MLYVVIIELFINRCKCARVNVVGVVVNVGLFCVLAVFSGWVESVFYYTKCFDYIGLSID